MSSTTAKISPLIIHVKSVYPNAKRLIDKFRLDFQGKSTLLEAVNNNEKRAEQLVRDIELCMDIPAPTPKHFDDRKSARVLAAASPPQLVQWIADRFHEKLRRSLPTMMRLLEQALDQNTYTRELNVLEEFLRKLNDELSIHIAEEENGFFQDLVGVECNERIPNTSLAIQMETLREDWDTILSLTKEIRQFTNSYTLAPSIATSADAQELFAMLREWDSDLQEHWVAEQIALFPLYVKSRSIEQ